jgi:hypothetical protein
MKLKNRFSIALLCLPLAFVQLACPTRLRPETDGGADRFGSVGNDAAPESGMAGRTGVTGTGGGHPEGGGTGIAGASGNTGGAATGVGGAAGTGGAGTVGAGGAGGGTAGGGGGAGRVGGTGGAAGSGGASGASGSGGAAGGIGGGAGSSGCAPSCDPTRTCVVSGCLLNDGQPCTLKTQCASGACTPFYQDVDGDGYGTGVPTGFCGTSTPVGYSSQTGDCCDNAANLTLAKLIHPNAGFQTTSAGGVCGVTWDYDCDGMIETSLSMGECDPNAVYPSCTPLFMNYPESDCGTAQFNYTCQGEAVPNPSGPGTVNVCAGTGTGGPQTLGCK